MPIAPTAASFKWDLPTGLLACAAATLCLVPTVGFLLAWHQLVDLRAFTTWVTLPALVLLGLSEAALRRKSPLLFNRFAAGLLGGLAGTLALDAVRWPAAHLFKGAPDWVPLIGQYLTHETIGIAPTGRAVALGVGYHYLLVGALLGAAYSLVLGRGRWTWAVASALVASVGFMVLPQASLLAVATGFDLPTANVTWTLAFLAGGLVLGVVVQRLGRTVTNALYVVFLREEPVEALAVTPRFEP